MNLFLIRHAKAESPSGKKSDSERVLSPEGIQILKNSISVWQKFVDKIDFIFSSPVLRSVQTAQYIKSGFQFPNDIIIENSLKPGMGSSEIVLILKTYKSENLFLIGHQPDISYAISEFTGCTNLEIEFKPASIVKINFEGKPAVGKGQLDFLIPPVKI